MYFLLNGRLKKVKAGLDKKTVMENLKAQGHTVCSCKTPPSIKTLEKWSMDGVAKATDGCRVEPDGSCVHGHKSWLLVIGVI